MKKLLFLFVALALFASCEKDEPNDPDPVVNLPLSNFSYVINNDFPPAEVVFTNSSAFSTNYIWEFGDGSTSTEVNPAHIYQIGGGYTVVLTANDDEGNSKSSSQTVFINELPTKLLLKRLTITKLPFTNHVGQNWDSADGPDIYISFQEMSYDFIFESEKIYNIEEADLPVSWIWENPNLDLVDIGHDFLIVFKEYDANEFAGMETPTEFLFDNYSGYPEIIEMTSPNGKFEFELEVVWQ